MSEPLLVIADDDPDMRALVRSALETDYPEALEIADGRGLFWELVRRHFQRDSTSLRDLVIVADIRMPVYNGLDVLDAWKDDKGEAPIVVITSFPDDEVRARVKRLGATLLPKPFSCAHLRAAVGAARKAHRS